MVIATESTGYRCTLNYRTMVTAIQHRLAPLATNNKQPTRSTVERNVTMAWRWGGSSLTTVWCLMKAFGAKTRIENSDLKLRHDGFWLLCRALPQFYRRAGGNWIPVTFDGIDLGWHGYANVIIFTNEIVRLWVFCKRARWDKTAHDAACPDNNDPCRWDVLFYQRRNLGVTALLFADNGRVTSTEYAATGKFGR